MYVVILPPVNHYSLFFFFSFHLAEKTALISGCKKDMRKSSSPSLSNCNSVLANKIFGIPLDELQQGGHPDNEVPFIVRHVVDYIEEHGIYFFTLRASLCFNRHSLSLLDLGLFFSSVLHVYNIVRKTDGNYFFLVYLSFKVICSDMPDLEHILVGGMIRIFFNEYKRVG